MLPEAKSYLNHGGLAPDAAAYATIGCFLGGVIGIQFVSRLLHHYIPSHVVDCDHSHDEDDEEFNHEDHHHDSHDHKHNGKVTEETPLLLSHDQSDSKSMSEPRSRSVAAEMVQRHEGLDPTVQRPSLQTRLTTRMSTFVLGTKSSCDEGGPCYGYSEPCGQECLKAGSRSATRAPTRAPTRAFGRFSVSGPAGKPSLLRTATAPHTRAKLGRRTGLDEEIGQLSPRPTMPRRPEGSSNAVFRGREGNRARAMSHLNNEINHQGEEDDIVNGDDCPTSTPSMSETANDNDPSHHHHVPTNAFLAIGLQTSIAIALHKLPEGFITYATNHANPKLGFTVFMALFIHNITEGFAMALPLYLAINSRWKAMFWSSLLGGVSQPLGAGVAALWFKIAGTGDAAPGDVVYGCMFAITSGIMASVALQLFSESLSLTHNRNICTTFAFIGMGILGISFALTAS